MPSKSHRRRCIDTRGLEQARRDRQRATWQQMREQVAAKYSTPERMTNR